MKRFHVTNNYAIINFDAIEVNGQADILGTKGFENLLKNFINNLNETKNDLYNIVKDVKVIDLIDLYKLLLIYDTKDAFKNNGKINYKYRLDIYNFTEQLYDYWRKIARFGFVKASKTYDPSSRVDDLITQGDLFNSRVIKLYRIVSQKLLNESFNVFRQLPAGINASMLYIRHKFSSNLEYDNIQNIPFVTKIVTTTPFIVNSKRNTRKHLFDEIDYNPLSKLSINKSHYVAFPIKVGSLLAFVYIHRDFIHQGVALSNLFEFANYNEYKNSKPDLVFVYGIKETKYDYKYYHDQNEDLHIGFVSHIDENDYFGYLKKMLLTLHNVKMIEKGNLPIHGAMVSVKLNDNSIKNIVVIGDSGAGKSETLEALRVIGNDKIKSIDIVFDDMGVFKLNQKGQVVASGTETGAFVRLDDLDTGYAYEIMDRAIFLNPNKVNARVVIPISSYKFIVKEHLVDMVLYANNYDEENFGVKVFENLDNALDTFKTGKRKAKGTTSEVGLVESYFANPFGPHQMQESCDILLNKYFNVLNDDRIILGEIYTKLAIDGFESSGPKEAAILLLEMLIK